MLFIISLFDIEPKPSISYLPWGQEQRVAKCKCESMLVCRNAQWAEAWTSTSKGLQNVGNVLYYAFERHKQQQPKKPSPSCFTTHSPILEGRNQPGLKIDMREERSRTAAEGEHVGTCGRWQLVAWISATQAGPTAILHSPCSPTRHGGPALHSSGPSRPYKIGHPHPAMGHPWCFSLG